MKVAIDRLDQEQAQIDVVWQWVRDEGAPSIPELDELLLDYAEALFDIGISRIGLQKDHILRLQIAQGTAQRLNRKDSEIKVLGFMALVYRRQGNLQHAIAYCEEALALSREIGSRDLEGQMLSNLGNCYGDTGEIDLAIEYYEQALRIAREIGDRYGEGMALGNLGIIYKDLGSLERAGEYHHLALQISRERNDRRGEGIDLGEGWS